MRLFVVIIMAALRSRCGHYNFAVWFLSSIFFPRLSQRPQIGCLPYFDTWCGPVRIYNAGLKCAARGSLEMQDPKTAETRHLGTIAQLCRPISSQLRHVSTIGKIIINSSIFPTCPHNMGKFGPLTAKIGSGVWGTPANFNGFLVLAALLHGTLVVGVSQTAALNRGYHLYSAGRPSRWALAHISSTSSFFAPSYQKPI